MGGAIEADEVSQGGDNIAMLANNPAHIGGIDTQDDSRGSNIYSEFVGGRKKWRD